jgi:hypothetical protein
MYFFLFKKKKKKKKNPYRKSKNKNKIPNLKKNFQAPTPLQAKWLVPDTILIFVHVHRCSPSYQPKI